MENKAETSSEQAKPIKKAGGHSKKSGSKPTANPMGRNRAKSTILANFEKNVKASNNTTTESNKPVIQGIDSERFKNLRAMFEKKNEDNNNENKPNEPGTGKMDPNRLKMFSNNNQEEEKKNPVGDSNVPKMSIKDRINLLMKSKEETNVRKTQLNDPILEKLRETNLDDESSGDNYSGDDDNLDISREEDDLDKSESLSEEKNENEKQIANENNLQENNKKDNQEFTNQNQKNDDLDKSESLDDD